MNANFPKHCYILVLSSLLFIEIPNIYGQNYIPRNITKDIYFGKIISDNIVLDENKSNEGQEEFCYNYIKKNYNIKSQKKFYFFPNYLPEFFPYTNHFIGELFYIASSSEIISGEVVGYTICRPIEIFKFYTILSGSKKITELNGIDYNHTHVLICSKKKLIKL